MRAFMMAAQSCAEALAKNAVEIQQQSLIRLAETNQKAMETIGQSFVDAWTAGMKPAR
jgi:hypothetical protein